MYKRLGNYKTGFSFVYANNHKIVRDKKLIEWFKSLHIPPAYQHVIINKDKRDKILAYGYDSKGRKQCIYNPVFVEEQQKKKYKKVILLHTTFQKIMKHILQDMMNTDTMKKEISMILYLITYCGFRIGNKIYEKQNNSYGISTIKFKHIDINDGYITFDFIGKKGVRNQSSCDNPIIYNYLAEKKLRFAINDNVFSNIDSKDVNNYLKQFHDSISCKDLRTWCANLSFLEYIQESVKLGDKKPVKTALEKVSEKLHNTSNVCKKSYVDPNIIQIIEEKIKNDDIK
jgi:DNA topoisomerase-1